MFSCFDRILACERQMDRQTDIVRQLLRYAYRSVVMKDVASVCSASMLPLWHINVAYLLKADKYHGNLVFVLQ